MSDLVKRLRQMDRGYPTILSTAADRIEQLERELAECHSDRSEWMQAIEQANKNGQQYEALQSELTAEKALADDLEKVSHGVSWEHPARAAYRKARGL